MINQNKIEFAFDVASRVYSKEISNKDGKELLSQSGHNPTSAQNLINNFKCLMEGKIFKRAMSESDIKYLLQKIREVHGSDKFRNSLSAMYLWLDYYERIYKTKRRNLRIYLDSLNDELNKEISLTDLENQFELNLSKSLLDTEEDINERLNLAERIPSKLKVTTYVFNRNPDVVALVLKRANGKCERCKREAPFKRAKDNTPYLEVHHIKQLANGGEDTVENAKALCPNCHRELHFGIL